MIQKERYRIYMLGFQARKKTPHFLVSSPPLSHFLLAKGSCTATWRIPAPSFGRYIEMWLRILNQIMRNDVGGRADRPHNLAKT
jgi:hypothetical protein